MCAKPVLCQPDFDKTFYLQTDTSAYSVGAILSQEGESTNTKPKHHPVTYYSTTFMPTEQQYDIYKQEFLAIIKALENWRAYLLLPEHMTELLPWYMQWSHDLVAEMHCRRLVWNEAHRTFPPPSSYHECGCASEWRCKPHDAYFIHDSCFYPGSGSFPPVKPPHM